MQRGAYKELCDGAVVVAVLLVVMVMKGEGEVKGDTEWGVEWEGGGGGGN